MSKEVTVKVAGSGIGFFGLLTICLICLKLTGHITLSWLWICLIPFIPLLIILGIFAVLFIVGILAFAGATILEYLDRRKYHRQ